MTTHTDTIHLEPTPPQPTAASGHGLQTSPLNILPAEIRNTIWEMVLTNAEGLNFKADDQKARWRDASMHRRRYPWFSDLNARHAASVSCVQITWALSLMATCQQVRSETKDLLLHLNDANIHIGEIIVTKRQELSIHKESITVLTRIPQSLGSASGRVVLYLEKNLAGYNDSGVLHGWTIPKLEQSLSKFAQAIRPFRLFIALDLRFAWWVSGEKIVCGRDVPVKFDDCVLVRGKIPYGDCVAAPRAVDETIDRRLSLLRRHGAHRLCLVRAMRRKWESGLEVARRYMQEIVDLSFEIPDDMADVVGPRRAGLKLRALDIRRRRVRPPVIVDSDSDDDGDNADDNENEETEAQDDGEHENDSELASAPGSPVGPSIV